MTERTTRIRASQIRSILPDDLEATNARVDNYIPSYDDATKKYTWVPNVAGASNIEELGDVDFDSGTPIDGYSLVYDDVTSKWKAELISAGDFSDGGEADGADRKIGNTDNFDLSLLTNNLSRLHIQNDGKVGIGTDAPDSLFHISGSGSEIARIQSSTGNGWIRFNEGAVARGYIGFSDASLFASMDNDSMGIRSEAGLFLGTNGDNIRIAIKADGKVGIGETVPGAKLDVNGDLLLQAGTTVNEFSIDGLLAGNSDDAIPTEKAVKTYSDVIDLKTVKNQDNLMIIAFKTAINGSLSQFGMIDNIVDEYEDETGIDTVNSLNESYNSAGDYYSPSGGTNTKLLLSLDGADQATSTTDESASAHTITFNGTAQLDTAIKKFGDSALLLDGNSDYLSIIDSADWDIVGSNADDWTIDLWVKHTDHVGEELYFAQHESTWENGWIIRHEHASGIQFKVISGGVTIIDTGHGGEITDTDWHHIALIKKANEYGIYKDGTQVCYVQDDSTDTFAGSLLIGQWTNAGFFDGSMDEIRIVKSNVFSASPNVGKTDTITTPTSAHAIDKTNMTLISDTFTAEAQPDSARLVMLEEDVDAITLNTHLKAYATRDGGSNWVQGTLSDEGDYDASKRILVADFTLAGSGTNMEYKITTLNAKDCKIHASSLNWS